MADILSPVHLEIVLILTIGSALAAIFGYITERMRFSPILGYLFAGYMIGPFSPGFVANAELSEQLAEIGVILMMFWVGLHIKWQELVKVKSIAITGAIGQTLCSAIVVLILVKSIGWSLGAGIVLGLGIGIASTVVLVRVLADNKLQHTKAGYISLSWLIFEDFIAVFALLLLPTIAVIQNGDSFIWRDTIFSFFWIVMKFIVWALFLFTVGRKIVSWLLLLVHRPHTRDLFTLALLALTFSITVGSAILTGTSIALGAFIAGLVLGQSTLQQEISANLLAMRDAFVVFFFLSIGMLFNPHSILNHLVLFFAILSMVLVIKPLAAWVILRLWKTSTEISLSVALALAQIGEFSFILAEEATKLKILPNDGFDMIVACAFVSLAINPLIMKSITSFFERRVKAG